ncbi:farnesyl cysteine-carboxyl methyltransferase [Gnomoniopsis smithogilvyi]|uniref:Protein-S-isoprenylcysteine O-methyltransferase n=1 Tax=Gnomoniopsis smithogilvyi TaxID=1191159 RepID=A0A9W9CWH1_9PEZI|nr:farnesyl cysteine-carboxyl methyltransferase [Gnomoniopsis smithogilvyi]
MEVSNGPSLRRPPQSPHAEERSEAFSPDKLYLPGQPKSLSGIALRAFCLGIALAVGCIATAAVLLATSSPLWRLPFFLTALATFHFLEFWTTAAYNTREAEVSSFLLTANWPAYAIAHSVASLECLVTNLVFPGREWAPFHLGTLSMLLGLLLVVIGQVVRSVAMIQAGPSFNHIVQQTQKQEHILVTTGIYGSLRHPSYFGFFWWGLGTQLVMGNVVCFVGYAAVLWRFFSSRIRHEELFLVKFFGGEYLDYRKKVGTKIPFVP